MITTLPDGISENFCPKINEVLEWEYLPIMYTIEFLVGLIGNLTVICGYLFCFKQWKCSNIYLFNLSITDLAFICTLPLLVNQYKNESHWNYGDFLCKLNRFLLYNNMYLSILFLTCISIDRYLLVKNPLKVYRFQRKQGAVLVCVLLYVFVSLALVPMFVFISPKNITHDDEKFTACVDFASSGDAHHSLVYSMCLTIFGFVLPQCVMIACGIQTARALKKMSREHRRNISLEKPLILVILAVGTFTLFFTPYHIMRNVRIISRMKSLGFSNCTKFSIKAGYTVTRPIAYLNATTNPIFYFLLGDKFRETLVSGIKSLFHRVFPWCRRWDIQEISSSYYLRSERGKGRRKTDLCSDSGANLSSSCPRLPTHVLDGGSSEQLNHPTLVTNMAGCDN